MPKKREIRITPEDTDELASTLDCEWKLRRKYKCSLPELREAALDHNVERCPKCGQWDESYSFTNDDGEVDGFCMNCRPIGKDDNDA